ncbi:GNAT family N-acetyltransferase [Candidatus Pacearchaeota archaeon]|nr:GNAT family N-acetyltransferase [Candidatus Pacearchaeota archaeon]
MKLVTKRLILRDLISKDAKDLVENGNDLIVSRYLALVPYPYTIKEAKKFISKCIKDTRKKPRKIYNLGIELKPIRKLIGMIGLADVNEFNGTGEVGYWLGKKYWRQGIMTEAFTAIIDFAFKKLKLRRIDVSASVENEASNNLIKKMSFKLEGIRRKRIKAKSTGKIHDEIVYGLLKEEWKK